MTHTADIFLRGGDWYAKQGPEEFGPYDSFEEANTEMQRLWDNGPAMFESYAQLALWFAQNLLWSALALAIFLVTISAIILCF